MTKKNDNVKEFKRKPGRPKKKKEAEAREVVVPEVIDPRHNMTQEEIEAFMKIEQDLLDGHIAKYAMVMPQIDHSGVTEEDEDEELFTVDLEKKIVTQQLGEGVAVRDQDGNITVVEDEDTAAKIKKAITAPSPKVEVVDAPVEEKPVPAPVEEKPNLQSHYDNLIRDKFVSKALGSLLQKMRKTEDNLTEVFKEKRMGNLSEMLESMLGEEFYQRRTEIRKAMGMGSGKIRYEEIPDWAKPYVDEYISNTISELMDMTERD